MDVWYAAYGSNLARDRFLTYLVGGCPPGATRTYPGARDPSPPRDDVPFAMAGGLFFAWESPTWGGGVAFFDARGSGEVLARAYRLTEDQFADVAAQEMHRDPGSGLDLATVVREQVHQHGPGRYETLRLVGELDGAPVLTFTAPEAHALTPNPPAAAYRAVIVRGLAECHGLSHRAAEDYLERWVTGLRIEPPGST